MRALLLSLCLLACGGSTGPGETSYPVVGRGEAAIPFDVKGWTVTLTIAELGFGPAYFCATAAASSDLCPVAVSEFAASGTVNALDPALQPLGTGGGQAGAVRSATFDYAWTWFPTQQQARPTAAAPRGHSAYFEGTAVKDAQTVHFVAGVDLAPRIQGTRAVEGVRVDATLDGEGLQLVVGVAPSPWWRNVDFDALALAGTDPVVIAAGSRAYESLVLALTASAPPSLIWTSTP